jgi:hypothetical protein
MLLPGLGLFAMITLSAFLIGLPGLAGYGVKELRTDGQQSYLTGDPAT